MAGVSSAGVISSTGSVTEVGVRSGVALTSASASFFSSFVASFSFSCLSFLSFVSSTGACDCVFWSVVCIISGVAPVIAFVIVSTTWLATCSRSAVKNLVVEAIMFLNPLNNPAGERTVELFTVPRFTGLSNSQSTFSVSPDETVTSLPVFVSCSVIVGAGVSKLIWT